MPMRDWTQKAYLRLCPEKTTTKKFGPERVKWFSNRNKMCVKNMHDASKKCIEK